MVLLSSNNEVTLNECPPFFLPSVIDEKRYGLKDFHESKALLIAFICNHCPYVRAIEDRLIALSRAFKKTDFSLVAICSNDSEKYPADNSSNLKKRWEEKNYGFTYLVDVDQSVAKAFGAVCTPDLFLFDQARKLFYHGQLDDNWQDENAVKSHDLKNAINAILDGKSPPKVQKPTIGCSIKWK